MKVEAERMTCPFCKDKHSAMDICNVCKGKGEVICVKVGEGIYGLQPSYYKEELKEGE